MGFLDLVWWDYLLKESASMDCSKSNLRFIMCPCTTFKFQVFAQELGNFRLAKPKKWIYLLYGITVFPTYIARK